MNKRSKGEKIFNVINIIFISFLCLTVILPFMNILATSLSSQVAVTSGEVKFLPVDITLEAYEALFESGQIFTSFIVSIKVTIIGTILSLIVSVPLAYTLSHQNLKHRSKIMKFFIFTFLFSGGMIPMFLTIKGLGLYNTIWALILPSVLSFYNVILIKNYMEGLPNSLKESASIDGASTWKTFIYIIIPMCKPVIATVTLFFAVGYWNNYFSGIMYITDPALMPLQTFLYNMNQVSNMMGQIPPEYQQMFANISGASVQTATIVVATVPILIVYPFLQKYFVKGIVVGANK